MFPSHHVPQSVFGSMGYFDNLIVMSCQHNLQMEFDCCYQLIWLIKQIVDFFNH